MALPLHTRCSKLAHCNNACSKVVVPNTFHVTRSRNLRATAAGQRSSTTSSNATSTAVATPATETRVAAVQVTLDASIEQVTVPLTDPNSRLLEANMLFPLGLVIENVNGEPVVTEVTEGGAAAVAGCREGDVVRATTAMTRQMTYPTMNIMFGGVGRPSLVKMLLPTTKVPFPKVLDAVRSNTVAEGGDGSVTLVLERVDAAAEANGSSNSRGSEAPSPREWVAVGTSEGGSATKGGAVFDPAIFE